MIFQGPAHLRILTFPFLLSMYITPQFAVEFDKRAAPSGIDRMSVVDAFAKAVPQPPYKVNLSNSEKTIMVNIAKGSCGVAVVDNFKGLGKFNLRLLATDGEGAGG